MLLAVACELLAEGSAYASSSICVGLSVTPTSSWLVRAPRDSRRIDCLCLVTTAGVATVFCSSPRTAMLAANVACTVAFAVFFSTRAVSPLCSVHGIVSCTLTHNLCLRQGMKIHLFIFTAAEPAPTFKLLTLRTSVGSFVLFKLNNSLTLSMFDCVSSTVSKPAHASTSAYLDEQLAYSVPAHRKGECSKRGLGSQTSS